MVWTQLPTVDASASVALALILAFFAPTAAAPVAEDPLLPMAAVLEQKRLQNESGDAQQWQESVGRKAMTAAEWGKQLSSFPFLILAW
jgi:hypothetical protein